jgi:signal transduction histidine kinase
MQPFFTTKDIGKGTGLGLSISRGIAERHGGRLYLDSNSVGGARFVLEVPFGQAVQMPSPKAA